MSVDRGRLKATWVLAGSCLDHLPQARQPSSTLGTLAGLAASRQAPCTACSARGRVFEPGKPCIICQPRVGPGTISRLGHSHGCHPCPACEGSGWRPRRKSDPPVDAYVGVPVPEQDDAGDVSVGAIRRAIQAERERPEIREANLRRATRLVESSEKPEQERYRWEDAWERMCAHGSYRELNVALELLRMRDEPRYSIIWQIVCMQQPIRLSEGRQAFLNESMVALAALMPEKIKVPWWLREDKVEKARKRSLWRGRSPAHDRERRERDAEVRRLADDGWSVGQLQRRFGLSKSQVNRIRQTGPRERSQT